MYSHTAVGHSVDPSLRRSFHATAAIPNLTTSKGSLAVGQILCTERAGRSGVPGPCCHQSATVTTIVLRKRWLAIVVCTVKSKTVHSAPIEGRAPVPREGRLARSPLAGGEAARGGGEAHMTRKQKAVFTAICSSAA